MDSIKPFLIGVSGVSGEAKTSMVGQIAAQITNFPICTIALDNYLKSPPEGANLNDYNFYSPDAFDFDLLVVHIAELRNGKAIEMPEFDFTTKQRKKETKHINSTRLIIFEGHLAFYDPRIRNLMDLKIFIETDSDMRLLKLLNNDSQIGLDKTLTNYHKYIKPAYDTFFKPTINYADIIIPREEENAKAAKIVSEYLQNQLTKILTGNIQNLFSSINEVIDPKFQFYNQQILVIEDADETEIIKQVFKDVITNDMDSFIVEMIRKQFIDILSELLMNYLRKTKKFMNNLPHIDLIVTEFDDLDKIEWGKYKNILLFKTLILTQEDMKVPEIILEKNKKCSVVVCSIFLAPKFADILMNSQLDTLLLNTLYFSDFFIKFEHLIRKDQTAFNAKELSNLFKQEIPKLFMDQQ